MGKSVLAFMLILSSVLLAGCADQEKVIQTMLEDSVVAGSSDPKDRAEPESPAKIVKPIYAAQIRDGTYEIIVDSSSSMFRVVHCELTVVNDAMYAVMTMSGTGYGFVFMGTGEEALQASEETYIPFVLNEDEAKTFTVPVEALNVEIACAAWSIRRETWYDRVLIFESAQIPTEAVNTTL